MIGVDKAGFRFGEKWIFRGVDFTLDRGKVGVILGPNGRGKTTLLKTVLGLLKPASGKIEVTGRIGYVAQRNDMVFSYRVLDIVVMGRAAHIGMFSMPSAEDYRICRRILERLGLADFAHRAYAGLSGGERQMVMIARALASECDVLVLDEPASALDFSNQVMVLDILRRVVRKDGLTVLMTSHFPQHALHLGDMVLLMHGTEHHEWGAAAEMLTEKKLESLYGVPVKSLTFKHRGKAGRTLAPVFP